MYEYLEKYIDYEYHPRYDKERSDMHNEIINSYFINKLQQDNKKVIFTCGCYGAGKGHTMRRLHNTNKINLDNYVYVDPDKIRAYIPEYNIYLKEDSFTAGSKTNKEAGYIAELIQLQSLFNGYNLIVDGSMKDFVWYKKHIEWIKETFPQYEIIIIFVEASWLTVIERIWKRAEVTRRLIKFDTIKESFESSFKSFKELNDVAHKSFIVNNDNNDNNGYNDNNKLDIIEI
jgi:hypothetical protein